MNVLKKRKEKEGVNIEYQFTEHLVKEGAPTLYGTKIETISIDEIIKQIEVDKKDYYTQDLDGKYSLVVVKGGDKVEKYLSSIANDGKTDNIDKLPTY